MVNLLGDGERRPARLPGVAEAALADPAVHLHLYDKREVFEGRKMGHLTALGPGCRRPPWRVRPAAPCAAPLGAARTATRARRGWSRIRRVT